MSHAASNAADPSLVMMIAIFQISLKWKSQQITVTVRMDLHLKIPRDLGLAHMEWLMKLPRSPKVQ